MLRTTATTLTHLLAIIGAGFLLASAHAYVRTAWMDQPAVSVTRAASVTPPAEPKVPDPRPIAEPTTEVPSGEPGAAPDPRPDAIAEPPAATDPVLDAPVKAGAITLREARDLFEQGAFFLDARYEDEYDAGRIEGAFWMTAARVMTDEGRMDLDIIEPGGTIVIYCTGGDCDASENTANRIELLGYSFDIRILGKGYTDWVEAGLPTESGRVTP